MAQFAKVLFAGHISFQLARCRFGAPSLPFWSLQLQRLYCLCFWFSWQTLTNKSEFCMRHIEQWL